ncbi:MAG: DUF177 domain-containing protein [Clostridiaceae bacterium]
MFFNINELKKNKVSKSPFEIKYSEDIFKDGEEIIQFLSPIEIIGEFSPLGDIIYLNAKLNGVLLLTCSRCLEEYEYTLQLDLSERFTTDLNSMDEETILISEDKIDITELVRNNIVLSLPIQKLCREDCKGLCPKCGTNLNLSTCNCDRNEIDPRLEKLKDLFSED